MTTSDEDQPGRVRLRAQTSLDRYQLLRELASGGMGTVYKAIDPKRGRTVALKVLNHNHPEALMRLQREAKLASGLTHPHIIQIYEIGSGQDLAERRTVHYISMAFVEGSTLVSKLGRIDLDSAMRLLEQVIDAIAYAHQQGVLHRDIKPGNILLNSEDQVVVTDFGLARAIDQDDPLTQTGTVMGTARYMSPEQVLGMTHEIDHRTDIWALGVVMYELLTGLPPFDGDTSAEIYQRIRFDDPVPPRALNAAIPRPLELLCLKALEKDAHRRFDSAAKLGQELRRWQSGQAILTRPQSLSRGVRRSLARGPGKLVVILLLLAGIVGVSLSLSSISHQWDDAGKPTREDLTQLQQAEEQAARQRKLQARLRPIALRIGRTRSLFYIQGSGIRARLEQLTRTLAELRTIATDPQTAGNAEVWSLLGIGWYHLGQDAPAETALLEARRLAPHNGRAIYYLGRIYLERSIEAGISVRGHSAARKKRAWLRKAREVLDRPVKSWDGVQPVDRHILRAYQAHAQGNYSQVAALCAEGLERYSQQLGSEDYWFLDGLIKRGAARMVSWTRALERRPHFPRIRLLLAWERMNQRNYQGAIADASAGLELRPDWWSLYNMRGGARKLAGDMRGALEDFDKAIELAPENAAPIYNRGFARRETGNLTGAIQDMTRVIQLWPQLAVAYNTRGHARHQLEQYAGALADYGQALRIDKTLKLAWINRGQLRLERGDFEAAARDFTAQIKLSPDDADGYFNRSLVSLRQQKYKRALADLNRALSLKPRHSKALINRGLIYLNQQQLERALAEFEAALRAGSNAWQAHANIGLIRSKLGQPEAAIRALRKARGLAPTARRKKLSQMIRRLGGE